MIVGDTPRLPQSSAPRWIGMGAMAVYFVAMAFIQPRQETVLTVLGLEYGAVGVLAPALLIRNRLRRRRLIESFRSLSDDSRLALTAGLRGQPSHLEREVSWHGRPETAGLIERFRFSPIDQRETRILAVLSWAGFAVTAVAPAIPGFPFAFKLAMVLVAALFVLISVWLSAKSRALSRWFEVSPFGLSEVYPDGRIRRALWDDMSLSFRANESAMRFELSVRGGEGQIDIPWTVVQCQRLVQLILEKGGFS